VLLAAALVMILADAAVLDLMHPFGSSPGHPFGHPRSDDTATSGTDAAATATVTRSTLSSQTTVDSTLGYADGYTITNQLAGTGTGQASNAAQGSSGSHGVGQSSAPAAGSGQGVVTGLPKPGRVIGQGRVLYRVDGQPVVLLYGPTPAYRTLAEGGSAGADVRQLNADLVALGYASKADLDPSSDEFGSATKAGVEKLQDHLGVDQTGALDLGQVVFLPTAVRVTSVLATLGGSIGAGSPVFTGTSTTRQVTVNLDTGQQSEVKAGDQVTITLPNNQTTAGVVSTVGTVASSSGAAGGGQSGSGSAPSDSTTGSGAGSSGSGGSQNLTVEVDVRLTHPGAVRAWDQAPVQVTITTDTVHNALVIPVVALLAQAGGGHAVEVIATDGTHRLVPVSVGLFDDADGLVQVTSTTLSAGQRVVVPKL
jgi:hypothetical protein